MSHAAAAGADVTGESPYLPFRGHNIILPGGTETKPGAPVTASNHLSQAMLKTLSWALPKGGRVADLGSFEGGYSLALAWAGYDVTGFEIRQENFDRACWMTSQLAAGGWHFPNLRFIQDDVRNLENHGEFDAVFCAGVLYHLEYPADFIWHITRVIRRCLILQTHVSGPDKISQWTEHDGYTGHWYNDSGVAADPFGSWGNKRSFWLTEPSLLECLRSEGRFQAVYRQYDYLPDIMHPEPKADPFTPSGDASRGMYVGVKYATQ